MLFTEETGATLDSVTFLVFGAVLLGPEFKHLSWHIFLYAVLSLTVVRMVPVAIALFGTHARPATVAFMGWFGPRGLASIVFAVIVEDAHLPHSAEIATVTYLTVGLSVLVHGLSASPLVNRYVELVPNEFGQESARHGDETRPRIPTSAIRPSLRRATDVTTLRSFVATFSLISWPAMSRLLDPRQVASQ